MDIFDRIAQTLENRVRSGIGRPYFRSAKYRVHEFSTTNFTPIEGGDKRLVAFIDGGNSPILEGPGISVQLNRVALGLFRGGQRVQPEMPSRIEFFSVMTMNPEEEMCIFQIHPIREEYLEFLPDEDDMHLELEDTDTVEESTLKGLPRRFAEWSMALAALDELDAGDVLVRDGSLQASFEKENSYINKLGDRAGEIHVTGLSKTCTLYTTTSISLLSAIGRLASERGLKGAWCYHPIAIRTDRPTTLTAVKLNPAGRIFRMDILGEYDGDETLDVASTLSLNARDACFPGYPYGLVDVDMRARVSGDEVEIYRRRVLSQIRDGKVLRGIKYETESLDYHDTLNSYAGED
ncbi:DNA double-strand break repair nuclease NurA [Methanothermobacter sp. K4]|uniref:DNA double-strand break repair nuclease NurA n=1 Tax=Methanothermobacter sp. K4 TaxID=2913262 RepID=UPI001EDBD8AD|nr:DNA double-strand break repair nuclease NurA [Methanothermobacter sp. K4]MCG2828532.1 DNA double-strand break repair nuclease NurA [Methanothermobacter sp. K4]